MDYKGCKAASEQVRAKVDKIAQLNSKMQFNYANKSSRFSSNTPFRYYSNFIFANPVFQIIRVVKSIIWRTELRPSLIYLVPFFLMFSLNSANAYPIFAQQMFENPREENGRIVCANCHLALKPVDIELPQTIFPSQIFNVKATIPVSNSKQILGNGQLGSLNVGGIVIFPKGFELASKSMLKDSPAKSTRGFYQSFSKDRPNVIIFGPLPSKKFTELNIPMVAANPEHLGSFPIYFGGNRGRGQVYPDGQKSNNTVATSPVTGLVKSISEDSIDVREDGKDPTQIFSIKKQKGLDYNVIEGQSIVFDEIISKNPNIGGFGQVQKEIIVQSPTILWSLQAFIWSALIAQVALVLKKKQIELVVN